MTVRHAIPILLLAVAACNRPLAYEFEGAYRAPVTGFEIDVLSRGAVDKATDSSTLATALVQVCPAGGQGRAFRFRLSHVSGHPVRMDCVGPCAASGIWSRRTSRELLEEALQKAGFRKLDPAELEGGVIVVESSLYGPKGVIMEGQIDSLRVIRAEPRYLGRIWRGEPTATVDPSELPPCP